MVGSALQPGQGAEVPGGAAGQPGLVHERAVAHRDQPVRGGRDPRVVGDDDQRLPGRVQARRTAAARPGWPRCRGCRWARRRARPAARCSAPGRPRPAAAGRRTAPRAGTGPVGEPDLLQQLRAARRRAARGERPASSAGSSTFSTAVSSSIRWKAWKTKPTASRRSRARAFSLSWSMRCPASHTSPPRAGRARRAGAAASTSRSRSAPSRPPSRPRRRRGRPRRRRAPALRPCRIPCAARGRCSTGGSPRASLMMCSFRLVQFVSQASSQRRSACSRSTMPSSSSAGGRAVRLGHGGPLGVAQPAQQLAALGVDDGRAGRPHEPQRPQMASLTTASGPGALGSRGRAGRAPRR